MSWKREYKVGLDHGFPEYAEVDVLVVGGGAAGVAAAETASRHGNKVMLIERYGFCGGASVAGLSGTICGLYLASESNRPPEQIVFGFTERFRVEMQRRGGITEPLKYGKTWTVTHDPLIWREVADDFLLDSHVKVLYHTSVIGVVMEDHDVKGVIINSKSGRSFIKAKVIIDASGDADIVYRAGFEFSMGDNGRIQNPTMIFRIGGVDVERFQQYWGNDTICSPEISELISENNKSGRYNLPRSKSGFLKRPGKTSCSLTLPVSLALTVEN